MRWHLLLGRLLFGGVLLCAAARQVTSAGLSTTLAALGVPYASFVALASTGVLAVAGASIVLGLWSHVGLRLTVLYLLPATAVQHAFWTVPDAAARATELATFLSHVALIGATVALLAVPRPWPFSVDAWLSGGHAGAGRTSGLQLRAAGRWLDASLRRWARAAIRLMPAKLRGPSHHVDAVVEHRDRARWSRDPAGTIVHMRRAVRTPSGRIVFIQSMRAHFRTLDREYG